MLGVAGVTANVLLGAVTTTGIAGLLPATVPTCSVAVRPSPLSTPLKTRFEKLACPAVAGDVELFAVKLLLAFRSVGLAVSATPTAAETAVNAKPFSVPVTTGAGAITSASTTLLGGCVVKLRP